MQIIFNQYTNAYHVVRNYYRNTLPCSCRLISAVMPGPSPLFFTINIGLSSASSKLFTRCPLLLAVIVSLTCHTNIITIMQLPVASLCTHWSDKLTCMSFFTTSRPRIWSNTAWRNWSVIMDSFSLSRCHMSTRASSIAVMLTWKYSSVDTPNHSGESRNWCGNTMCNARPFCDTTNLTESLLYYCN